MPKAGYTVEVDATEVVEGMNVEGSYGYDADYAPYVNWETSYAGTSPPFDKIRGWVDRKWNELDAGLKDAAVSGDPSNLTSDEWKDRVASLVVNAIAKNGTKAVRFMERSMEQAKSSATTIAQSYENSNDPDAPFAILRDFLDYAFGQSQDIVADEATDRGTLLQSGWVDVSQLDGNLSYDRDGGGS